MSRTLTIQAPDGASFEFDEVKTDKGQRSLGEVPILKWNDVDKARAYYGDEGILNILDGTSVRVSMQSIARRKAQAAEGGVTEEVLNDIAKTQVEFKPGSRQGGQSTPESRAQRAAKDAAKKVNGDAISELLAAIASGKIGADALRAMGIESPLEVGSNEEAEEETADVGA